jgi:hypothetical protein
VPGLQYAVRRGGDDIGVDRPAVTHDPLAHARNGYRSSVSDIIRVDAHSNANDEASSCPEAPHLIFSASIEMMSNAQLRPTDKVVAEFF